MTNSIQTVGIMGAGLIGSSWATLFLANGFDVLVTDIQAESEEYISDFIATAWPIMEKIGLKSGADKKRWNFSTDVNVLEGAEFVQENGPENAKIKRAMIGQLNDIISENAIIASSTSGILVDDINGASKNPDRVIVGHPFNPPHIIPLVEIVGGKNTPEAIIAKTKEFYRSTGKHPILLKKPIEGHIANRLQAAVMRESLYLLDQGIASADDIDAALSQALGLRYAMMGQFMIADLAGGDGGIEHAMKLLGPAMGKWFGTLSNMDTYPNELQAETIKTVSTMMKAYDRDSLISEKDETLINILKEKAKAKALPK